MQYTLFLFNMPAIYTILCI